MDYICSKTGYSIYANSLHAVGMPEPFRGECIINSENDDKPDLSSLPLRRFTEDQSVCKTIH